MKITEGIQRSKGGLILVCATITVAVNLLITVSFGRPHVPPVLQDEADFYK